MAGWLFADLLLGLSMLFLIANTVGPKPTPTPTFTLTPTYTSTPRPTMTYTPTFITAGGDGTQFVQSSTPTLTTTPLGLVGLSNPQCYAIYMSSFDMVGQQKTIVDELRKILPDDEDKKAGMIIVWGNGGDSLEGRRIAQNVGGLIKRELDDSFDENTQQKFLFLDTGDKLRVLIEVYFFTNAGWKSGYEVDCNSRW